MKISMKMLAASVALVTLTMSGVANAGIAVSSGSSQGGAIMGPGELFLTAFDAVGKQSYSRDLGIYETAMVANPSQTLSFDLNTLDTNAPDTNWATFISTGNKGVGVVYTVTAANIDPTIPTSVGFVTTSPSAAADIYQSVQSYSMLINSTQSINSFAQDSNAAAGQTAVNTWADNNSSRSVPGDTGYFDKTPAVWGINDGGKTFLTIGQIGSSVAFYSALATPPLGVGAVTKLPNVWKLDPAGRLTYSAVPVPAALWLFGSGILGLASIGRRRKV